jgi:hypothetical protein
VPAKPGRDYERLAVFQPTAAGGRQRIPLGLTSKGDVISVESPKPTPERLLPPMVVTLVGRDGTVRRVSDEVKARQVAAIVATGGVLAYRLTSSVSMYEADWQVYASAGGERPRLLGDSAKLTPGTTPVPPEYRPLSTDGRTVYWTAPTVVGTRPVASIFAPSVDGSEPAHELIKGAKLPNATRQGLWYVRGTDVAPDLRGVTGEIRLRKADGTDTAAATVTTAQGERSGRCARRKACSPGPLPAPAETSCMCRI